MAFSFLGSVILLIFSFLLEPWEEEIDDPILLTPEIVDFGRVFDGDSPVKPVVLRNQGAEPLLIQRISTSCGCAVPRILFPGGKEIYPKEGNRPEALGRLEPGEEAKIEVTFQTWGYKGKLEKRIDIETDAKLRPRRQVTVLAEIIDAVRLDPAVLDLGSVVRGQLHAEKVRVHSVGIGDFEIEGIRNLPPYLVFRSEKIAGGAEAEHLLEIQTREEPPLGEWSLVLQVEIKNEYTPTFRIPLQAEILPKVILKTDGIPIRNEIDFGVFSSRKGKTVVVDIENLAPAIPFHPMSIEIESMPGAELFSHRLETVEPGVSYRLHLTIRPGAGRGDFVRAWLVLQSDHPDMLENRLHLIGWAGR